jgi:aspartate racemase
VEHHVPDIPDMTASAPLAFAQEGLWFLSTLGQERLTYNVGTCIRLTGRLSPPALEWAVNAIVERHAALRTRFEAVDGTPRQIVTVRLPGRLETTDLTDLQDPSAELARCAEDEARAPFDLTRAPLLRARLFRLADDDHAVVVTVHHIACDGWSIEILKQELAAFYSAAVEGRAAHPPRLALDYAGFAARQRERLDPQRLDALRAYWDERLRGAPVRLDLPSDRPRPASPSRAGAIERFTLTPELTRRIVTLSAETGVTPFVTLLAAWKVLLYRYSNTTDLTVGTPVSIRDDIATESLVGYFVDTLVLRTDVSGDPTFRALVERVQDVVLEAVDHRDLPFQHIVERLRQARRSEHDPVIQVMFVLQDAEGDLEHRFAGLTAAASEVHDGQARLDLTVQLEWSGDGLAGTLVYAADRFDAPGIRRMIKHYQTLLQGIADEPDARVSALPMLTEAERRRMLETWNDTAVELPPGAGIPALFERQARRDPERVAVVCDGHEDISYGELDRRASRLAGRLQAMGVEPGGIVGVCADRGPLLVQALLGVLKAGCAYLPLDPAYPAERLAFMLADSGAALVLVDPRHVHSLPAGPDRLDLETIDWTGEGGDSGAELTCPTGPESLAYVIYTSGSTGRPKGVCVPHRGVVRLVTGGGHLAFGADEVFLQLAPISFDASTLELWGPLLTGGRLAVLPPGLPTVARIGAAVRRHGVTTLVLTTGLFHQVVDAGLEGLSTLRQLLTGGDVLSADHAARAVRALPGTRIVNAYGPTEVTVISTAHDVADTHGEAVPIGRPIGNTEVYVLDGNGTPVPVGVPGELHVGGPGLALGYLGRPELTAELFIPNPFSADPGSRLYRTGDVVRWAADGTLRFLGRVDRQVKIRGFRVELGEVEHALQQHPGAAECVVGAMPAPGGAQRLVAHVVPVDGRIDPRALQDWVADRLPRFMVPSAVVVVDALPLTANGKVDRAALPAPDLDPDAEAADAPRAPRDDLELVLTQIWQEVLGVGAVGVTDDFFLLGGHSLLAVRLVAALDRRLGIELPIEAVFAAPTIERMAERLRAAHGLDERRCVVALQPAGDRPPFFFVHALGGTLLRYAHVARCLAPEQPFYGLQARGLDPRRDPHETVEAMAAHYVEEIRTVQPAGPYRLGGYSGGGLIALEMAQQLRAAGEAIALVVLVDTVARPELPGDPGHWAGVLADRLGVDVDVDRTGDAGSDAHLRALLGSARRDGALPPGYGERELRRLLDLNVVNAAAFRQYAPGPYGGRVVLLRTADAAGDGAEDLGWTAALGQPPQIHAVDGDHSSMLDLDHAPRLAARLIELLEQP